MNCKNCSNYGTCNIDDMYGCKTMDTKNQRSLLQLKKAE